jgi:hypothetical protein
MPISICLPSLHSQGFHTEYDSFSLSMSLASLYLHDRPQNILTLVYHGHLLNYFDSKLGLSSFLRVFLCFYIILLSDQNFNIVDVIVYIKFILIIIIFIDLFNSNFTICFSFYS